MSQTPRDALYVSGRNRMCSSCVFFWYVSSIVFVFFPAFFGALFDASPYVGWRLTFRDAASAGGFDGGKWRARCRDEKRGSGAATHQGRH